MTKSEIFKTAHTEARAIKARFGGSYAQAFKEALDAVYSSIRAAVSGFEYRWDAGMRSL